MPSLQEGEGKLLRPNASSSLLQAPVSSEQPLLILALSRRTQQDLPKCRECGAHPRARVTNQEGSNRLLQLKT